MTPFLIQREYVMNNEWTFFFQINSNWIDGHPIKHEHVTNSLTQVQSLHYRCMCEVCHLLPPSYNRLIFWLFKIDVWPFVLFEKISKIKKLTRQGQNTSSNESFHTKITIIFTNFLNKTNGQSKTFDHLKIKLF